MMNNLYKSLTIAFVAVSILISGLTVDFVGAQNTAADLAASRPPADLLLSRHLRFDRLTSEDGLSGNQIYNVAQDSYGFMWFGTANELNRYDGASVKVYRHNPDDPSSLSHSAVRAMIVDRSGDLWLGTWGGGLNQYDSEKDAFIWYQHNSDDSYILGHNKSGEKKLVLELSDEKTAWLKAHARIELGYTGDFPPYLIEVRGGTIGFLPDLFVFLNQRL